MEIRQKTVEGDRQDMSTLIACVCGFLLDLLFGDPKWLYHPVRLMGVCISFFENRIRRILRESKTGQLIGGGILWCVVVILFTAVPWSILWLAGRIHPMLRFGIETFWCYQILAAKSLKTESMRVYNLLLEENLPKARYAVSMIVGRDTENLDETGVTKAAVETVAENTSDGVTAPLMYMLLGGAVLGFTYKAVNTMDSMLGYKDEKYLYIGRVAAKMDDAANYIPARLTALFMIAASGLCGMDWKNAWHIFRRDRYKHSSPNSAQTEAVCAGALRIRLAGDAWYFGKLYPKEYIGEDLQPVEAEDIRRANQLMYVTAWLTLFVFGGLRMIGVLIG